jgi:hypothetical protein
MLTVRGGRAPVASDLTLLNAATGATLMTSQSDRRGRFRLSTQVPARPANIHLRMSSGAGSWTLGPVSVSGADVQCDRDDEDD